MFCLLRLNFVLQEFSTKTIWGKITIFFHFLAAEKLSSFPFVLRVDFVCIELKIHKTSLEVQTSCALKRRWAWKVPINLAQHASMDNFPFAMQYKLIFSSMCSEYSLLSSCLIPLCTRSTVSSNFRLLTDFQIASWRESTSRLQGARSVLMVITRRAHIVFYGEVSVWYCDHMETFPTFKTPVLFMVLRSSCIVLFSWKHYRYLGYEQKNENFGFSLFIRFWY